MTYRAIVHNGALLMEQSIALPEGTQVEVVLRPVSALGMAVDPAAPSTHYERYQAFIGLGTDLPPDLSENHDHYAHGAPREIDRE